MKAILLGLLGLASAYLGLGEVSDVYVNFASLVVSTGLITEALIGWGNLRGFFKQLVSWGMGIVLAFIGWLLDVGFLTQYDVWWQVVLVGLFIALAANGISDAKKAKEVSQWLIEVLKGKRIGYDKYHEKKK